MTTNYKVCTFSSSIGLKSAATFFLFFICHLGFSNDTLIWRSIPISSGKALTLGAPIEKLNEVTIFDKKKNYHLIKGTFAGADSITIKTDSKNIIKSLSFFYALTYTFEQHLEAMEKSLQKPLSLLTKENKKVATWQDKYTRFRLFWKKTKEGKALLYSCLEDL